MKIKIILEKVFGVIFSIYLISVSCFTLFYWWKDIKNHDSILRAVIISEWVGLFKATHWPYYEFKSKKFIIDENIATCVSNFMVGYESYASSLDLIYALPKSNNIFSDFEKYNTLLNESKNRFSQCDIKLLNSIYDGWGDMLANKFIPAVDLYLNGIKKDGDRNDITRGDALIIDVKNWIDSNWNPLMLRLSKKYGFEIMMGRPFKRLP